MCLGIFSWPEKTEPSGRPYCPNNQYGWQFNFLTRSVRTPIIYIQELGQENWVTAPSPTGGSGSWKSFPFCTNANQLNIMVAPSFETYSVQRMNDMKPQMNALTSLTGQGIMQGR
jgi:hypothetical protein